MADLAEELFVFVYREGADGTGATSSHEFGVSHVAASF